MNRDKLEKQRLMQRNEKHIKNYVTDNVIKDIKCKDDDKLYLRKDEAAYENYKIREKEKINSYIRIENRRNENRWQMAELKAQKEVDKTNRLQQMPFKSEKNKSKCNHDIINHEYTNYEESIKLEKKKNICANKRRDFLTERMSGSYNPITG
ncbi:conserved Plasmodium protein, unknown function [Plasmodium malariae]|uniref:Uncharacterized protein n=1 Tax=Plasmodium malariae TaxID=5858 RepID=A0A1A8WVT3_PLAMA|nr:conserved Plasmodium protein, unknown function [Plasmodium malariae]